MCKKIKLTMKNIKNISKIKVKIECIKNKRLKLKKVQGKKIRLKDRVKRILKTKSDL